MAVKKHGGPRPNSGRKPATDPKESVFIWIKRSVIKRHGGKDKLKAKLERQLEAA